MVVTDLKSWPKSSTQRTGWTMEIMTNTGIRIVVRMWRRNRCQVSRRNSMVVVSAPGRLRSRFALFTVGVPGGSQVHVIERRAGEGDLGHVEARLLEDRQQRRYG